MQKEVQKWFLVLTGIVLMAVVFGLVLFNGHLERVRAGSGDSVSGFAWVGVDDDPLNPGDTPIIGWLSFNSTNCDSDEDGATDQGNFVNCPVGELITNYGVDIASDGLFSGKAWSQSIGWVSFDQADLAGCPSGACQARLDFVTDEVSGWARALSAVSEPEAGGWDGWISLRGIADDLEEYGVYYDDSDPANARLMGWAWGGGDTLDTANIGWIKFSIWTEPPSPPPPPPPPPQPPVVPPGASQDNCSVAYCQQYVDPRTQYANCDSSSSCSGASQVYLGEVESTDCNAGAGSYCVCCADDWGPIVKNPNLPPDPPNELNETLSLCSSWGQLNQVALGLKIRLQWDYYDPEGDAQLAYEIQADDDSGFPAGKNRFNHIVEPSPCNGITGGPTCSYDLNLCDDDDDALCSDWLSELSWSKKYFWRVRAKDVASEQWSDWSDVGPLSPGEFVTPQHALPKPNFEMRPILPSVNEIIQVCARQEAGVCLTNLSECYDADDNSIACVNPLDPPDPEDGTVDKTYEWTINAPEGQFVNDSLWRKYNPFPIIQIDTQQSTSTNPQMRFDSAGLYANGLELKITDDLGSCSKGKDVRISIPLPKWKEVSP